MDIFGDDGTEGEFDQAGADEAEGEYEAGEEAEGEFDQAGADEFGGVRRRRGKRRMRRVSRMGAIGASANAAAYGTNPFGQNSRPIELQIPATTLAAGAATTITVTCGRPFAKLNVIKAIASQAGIQVTSMQVGDRNVNSGAGNIDATAYANPNDVINFAHCPVVTPSTPLTIGLSNTAATSSTLSGILRGWGSVNPGEGV